jgi:nitroreductase
VADPDHDDTYQLRYLAHQRRKRGVLARLLAERHSERMFDERPVESGDLDLVLKALASAPSSCDRRALSFRVVDGRDLKALLGGLLVGGVGWVHRAPLVVLLHADPAAYRAGDEIGWMPYLDAGVGVGMAYLAAGAAGLSCCYINPNIREANREFFSLTFGSGVYCGALALGYARREAPGWVGDTS